MTDELRLRLEGLGFTVTVDNTSVALGRGRSQQRYRLLRAGSAPLAEATRAPGPTLVFSPYVSPKSADAFRRADVHYLDSAGNAWIHFGDVIVDIRGHTRRGAAAAPRRGVTNLFSAGRAQVVFALLTWPELRDAPQRDLARTAGVSVGQAHNTLVLLQESGLDARSDRAARSADLLDLWAAAFPSGLGRRILLETYAGDSTSTALVTADHVVYVSGEAADPEITRSAQLVLYTQVVSPRLVIANRWRTDGAPNVFVRRKFWNEPVTPEPQEGAVRPAPWPLVYADLLSSEDPRGRAAAQSWRNRHEPAR